MVDCSAISGRDVILFETTEERLPRDGIKCIVEVDEGSNKIFTTRAPFADSNIRRQYESFARTWWEGGPILDPLDNLVYMGEKRVSRLQQFRLHSIRTGHTPIS